MQRLILVRHAHAQSNVRDAVSCVPPGDGLSDRGVEEALALREALADDQIDLGVASELRPHAADARAWRSALATCRGWSCPSGTRSTSASFEAGPLAAYRDWAWTTPGGRGLPGWRREPRGRRDPSGGSARGAASPPGGDDPGGRPRAPRPVRPRRLRRALPGGTDRPVEHAVPHRLSVGERGCRGPGATALGSVPVVRRARLKRDRLDADDRKG